MHYNFSYENYLPCKNIVIQFYTFDHPLKKPFIVVKVSRRHSFFFSSLFVEIKMRSHCSWSISRHSILCTNIIKRLVFSKCFAKGLNSNLSTLKPYLDLNSWIWKWRVNKHKKLIWIFRPWNCKLPWENEGNKHSF